MWKFCGKAQFPHKLGRIARIPHYGGLSALLKRLNLRQEKDVTTSTLAEFAEVALKDNIFTFKEKTLKQKRCTVICTKFARPFSILFMAKLEEEILSEIDLKSYLWWRYIDRIFFLYEHEEEKLKEFIEIHGRIVSNLDQLLGCCSFPYRWKSCYRLICKTYR